MSSARCLATTAACGLALLLAGAPAAQARHHHRDGGGGQAQPSPVVDDTTAPAPAPSTPLPTAPTGDPAPGPVKGPGSGAGTGSGSGETVEPDPEPVLPAVHESVVGGTIARLRTDGKAAIPRYAPKVVRSILRSANHIIGKPYLWGGGHQHLVDKGYDCSGAVSYALIKAGLQSSSMVSGDLARAYASGAGRYVSIYANKGHVYMEVAGLRLDTTSVGDPGGRDGVRWRPVIGKRQGFATRHPLGL